MADILSSERTRKIMSNLVIANAALRIVLVYHAGGSLEPFQRH